MQPWNLMSRMFVVVFVSAIAAPAWATLYQFNFNSIPLTGPHTSSAHPDGLSNAADSSLILTYMQGVLGNVSSVSGALAASSYSADGFGYGNTLGNTDFATSYSDSTHPSLAAPDEFLMNDDFGLFGAVSHAISITFTNIAITSVGFDWEIFADGNCGACAPSNPNFPDFEFSVDGGPPLAGGTFYASVIPGHDPQGIGTTISTPFVLNLPYGTHTLTFTDWPPEIGIDNLTIDACTSPNGCLGRTVPEPSPLSLAGIALALLALFQARARRGGGPAQV